MEDHCRKLVAALLLELKELMTTLWDLILEYTLLRKSVPSPGGDEDGGGSLVTSASAAYQYGFKRQVVSSTQHRKDVSHHVLYIV